MASKKSAPDKVDICISFDTTGSMAPAISQVRREVEKLTKELFDHIPNLRISIIAHGDYCDEKTTYVLKLHDLSDKAESLCKFVREVGSTGGGDSEECYELVLWNARTEVSWRAGAIKVLVLIGDDVPHAPNYALNKRRIDWRNELGLLLDMDVKVYGVHAMPGTRRHSKHFYTELAEKTDGVYLTLDQFSYVGDLIRAVCYRQQSVSALHSFEAKLVRDGRMNRCLDSAVATLLGRPTKDRRFREIDAEAVAPGRFQVLRVDADTPIKAFVQDNGAEFKKGRGFYELTKTETIQEYKEVILRDRESGDLFTGEAVRRKLGMPVGERARGKFDYDREKWQVFVQSTSTNRKLIGGTDFLYEVPE